MGICEWVILLEIIRSVEMLHVRRYAMYIWVKFLAQHYSRSVTYLPECMMVVFSCLKVMPRYIVELAN